MNKTIASFIEYLTSRECCYELQQGSQILRASIDGENARWRFLVTQDDAGRFVLISLIPVNAPPARRSACAELLAMINWNLGFGHFDLDFSDGELRYRTAVPLSKKGRLKVAVIEHVLHGHQVIVDRFVPVISAVLFANLSPEKALALPEEKGAPEVAESRFSLN